jgi:hypothetical protein
MQALAVKSLPEAGHPFAKTPPPPFCKLQPRGAVQGSRPFPIFELFLADRLEKIEAIQILSLYRLGSRGSRLQPADERFDVAGILTTTVIITDRTKST